MAATESVSVNAPHLRRALTLWDLILYGVVVIQPTAPMSVFGALSNRGHGHVVTTILIAMVAMLFTAFSYGRMARAYPSAGSAFTYVGQEINPALGYVTGWSMVMDYLLNPMICTIWCSQQAHEFAPAIPYMGWVLFFVVVFTGLNIQGIKTSARVNSGLAATMGVVIVIFFVTAARYIFGHPHAEAGFFTHPFYDPHMWNSRDVLGGTSVAVLTYIGFDGISTLSEEAENPRRNILLATVLTCLVIGILSAMEVYAAQLLWPASEPFPNVDTAFTYIAGRAWLPLLGIVGVTLLVANFGSALGAQIGAARLLFGMGRSEALPKSFFGVVEPKRRIPRNNVLFVGVLALAGSYILPRISGEGVTGFELGVNLLNFGALIAFMGVNLAAFVRYDLREGGGALAKYVAPMLAGLVIGVFLFSGHLGAAAYWVGGVGLLLLMTIAPPLAGFGICFFLWYSLSSKAMIFGAIWMAIGIAVGAWKTRGFRSNLIDFELPPDEA